MAWCRGKHGPEKLLRWNCRLSSRELEGTFSEAKETPRCNHIFSLTLPLPLIPISAAARMEKGRENTWLGPGWQGKDKSRRASKGSLMLSNVCLPDWFIRFYRQVRIIFSWKCISVPKENGSLCLFLSTLILEIVLSPPSKCLAW